MDPWSSVTPQSSPGKFLPGVSVCWAGLLMTHKVLFMVLVHGTVLVGLIPRAYHLCDRFNFKCPSVGQLSLYFHNFESPQSDFCEKSTSLGCVLDFRRRCPSAGFCSPVFAPHTAASSLVSTWVVELVLTYMCDA